MKTNKYLVSVLAVLLFVLVGCEKEDVAVKPKAEFKIFYGYTVSASAQGKYMPLTPIEDVVKITTSDTIVFKNLSTGSRSVIFTGDTIYDTNGNITSAKIANQEVLRFFNPVSNQYVRVSGNFFPSPNGDLALEYGNSAKRVFYDDMNKYYTGILTYKYARPGSFKVKVYTYNWNNAGIVALDSAVQVINVVKP